MSAVMITKSKKASASIRRARISRSLGEVEISTAGLGKRLVLAWQGFTL